MISGGIKQNSLRMKSVLTSVEQDLGFDGEALVFPSLSWAVLHGKIPSFDKYTPKLLLSRAIWEPLMWVARPLVEEHNWSVFLAPHLGNLWWIKAAVTYLLSILARKALAYRSKSPVDTCTMHGTPQCWENPETWCGEGWSEIQRSSLCCVCDERWLSGWKPFPTWWEWDAPGRRTHLDENHFKEKEVQEKCSVSSEAAHVREEGGQYRVYRVRRRVLHEKRGRWTEQRTKKGKATVMGQIKSFSKCKICIALIRWSF